MDILNDREARDLRHYRRATYRQIVDATRITLNEIKDLLDDDDKRGRLHRELRDEISRDGGIDRWWNTTPPSL